MTARSGRTWWHWLCYSFDKFGHIAVRTGIASATPSITVIRSFADANSQIGVFESHGPSGIVRQPASDPRHRLGQSLGDDQPRPTVVGQEHDDQRLGIGQSAGDFDEIVSNRSRCPGRRCP